MGKNTIVVCGHGPGISDAMARRFGRAGHPVAIIARNGERLNKAASALKAEGITVEPFIADLGDVEAVKATIEAVRSTLGPIEILHWNAFNDIDGDLLSLQPDHLRDSLNVRVIGYLAAVQASLADLEVNGGAVLATSGIMAFDLPEIDAMASRYAALAIPAAAQHKANGILRHTLDPRGIFVGEVIVNGFVKGTPGASVQIATIDPNDVAETFWSQLAARTDHSVVFNGATTAQSQS
ncbi:SDR family NAD(P)-dependent oxidoreductase [Pseudogemmobacter sonorensis]|uniref:SDR family NAD(P)-dependent oxidoreductase n=1 Tax=Pseudogemmobacter sonorensis TaxID=2989681 RepID=UPI0036CFE461